MANMDLWPSATPFSMSTRKRLSIFLRVMIAAVGSKFNHFDVVGASLHVRQLKHCFVFV